MEKFHTVCVLEYLVKSKIKRSVNPPLLLKWVGLPSETWYNWGDGKYKSENGGKQEIKPWLNYKTMRWYILDVNLERRPWESTLCSFTTLLIMTLRLRYLLRGGNRINGRWNRFFRFAAHLYWGLNKISYRTFLIFFLFFLRQKNSF